MFSIFSSTKESTAQKDASGQIGDEDKQGSFQRVKELLSESASAPDPTDDQAAEECAPPPDVPLEEASNSMIWRYLRAYSYDSNIAAANIS
jgi:hypothetical protein